LALGEFGAVLDSKTFTQIESEPPNLRKRTKNVALLLTLGPANGYMYFRSIAIDDSGLIDATPIDTMAIETWTHRDKGLIHWLDDVFAAYSNDHNLLGHLWTVGCDQDGVITDSPLDYLQVGSATQRLIRSDLFKPHDGILLTGPCLPSAGVYLQTVPISDAGFMPDSVEDSMELPVNPYCQRFRQGAGNRIIDLAYLSAQYYIYSLTCTAAGDLPAAVTDSWGPISSTAQIDSLTKISDTVFALFARDGDGTQNIHTFSINPDGTINKTWIDSENVGESIANHHHMMEMGRGYFVVAYRMEDPKWRLKTYFIAHDGQIQDGHIDTMDMGTGNRGNERFEHLHGNIWTLTYEDVEMSVRIDTIEIDTPLETRARNELTMGIGP